MGRKFLLSSILCAAMIAPHAARAGELHYEDYPIIKLRSLDKITARTMNFEAKVGSTIRFGDIFIKVQACRKPPPVEKNEAAGFLQIYQADELPANEAKGNKFSPSSWIFSGWMFASSPALSAMDHPIYDVWVLDCLGKDPEPLPPPEEQVEAIDKTQTDSSAPETKPESETESKPESEPEPTPAPTKEKVKEKDNTIYHEPRPKKANEPSLDEMLQPDKAVQNNAPSENPTENNAPLLTAPAETSTPNDGGATEQNQNFESGTQEPATEDTAPDNANPQNNIDAIY